MKMEAMGGIEHSAPLFSGLSTGNPCAYCGDWRVAVDDIIVVLAYNFLDFSYGSEVVLIHWRASVGKGEYIAAPFSVFFWYRRSSDIASNVYGDIFLQ